MMKLNRFVLSCSVALLTLTAVGCKKYHYEEPSKSFAVVRTTLPDQYTGGEGSIELTEAGFEVKSDQPWVKVEKVSETKVKVTISANTTPIVRTANIILLKGGQRQEVPVTQLALVDDIVGFKNIEFDRKGGTQKLEATFGNEATIEIKDQNGADVNWVTASLQDGKLVVTAQPLPAGSPDRSVALRVRAGLFDRVVAIKQILGSMPYADYLGDYSIAFDLGVSDTTRMIADVKLVKKEEGKSFTLKGLPVDLTVAWDARTGAMTITPSELPKPSGLPANQEVYLVAWAAGYPKANGSPNYSFRFGEEVAFRSVWNRDLDNPAFGFICIDQSLGMRALAFILLENKKYKEFYGPDNKPGVLSDFVIVKKK